MKSYDVFLSHATADKPAIEALARRFSEDGLEPFLDMLPKDRSEGGKVRPGSRRTKPGAVMGVSLTVPGAPPGLG